MSHLTTAERATLDIQLHKIIRGSGFVTNNQASDLAEKIVEFIDKGDATIAMLSVLASGPMDSPVPKIQAKFELRSPLVIATRTVPVSRVEHEDDGSLTVVLNYWPESSRQRTPSTAPPQAPMTLADVLDALNVFNKATPREDDGKPWGADDFIRVDHLPDLINKIIAAREL